MIYLNTAVTFNYAARHSLMLVSGSNSTGSNLNVLCTAPAINRIGVKCIDALNNPVTLQALRSLDLRHKHSEMTMLKFAIFMSHLIEHTTIACCICTTDNTDKG